MTATSNYLNKPDRTIEQAKAYVRQYRGFADYETSELHLGIELCEKVQANDAYADCVREEMGMLIQAMKAELLNRKLH